MALLNAISALRFFNVCIAWGDQCTWSPGSNRSAGVAVLIHPNSPAKLVDSKTDLAGRVVTAFIDFHGHHFQLINV